MSKAIYYVCIGDVRGNCGHRHRSIDAAIACLDRDTDRCAQHGGYSDRSLYARLPDRRLEYIPTILDDDDHTVIDVDSDQYVQDWV